jgi:hypothetical protein
MTIVRPGSHTLMCGDCEVYENGTISGRKTDLPDAAPFGDDVIRFTDHGGVLEYPSPDSQGFKRTWRICTAG